jgi:hypothetical protein
MSDIATENAEGTKALQHYFASCSVVINSQTPGFEHGTGVAVRHKNNRYIVTAAHVLEKEPKDENLIIIGKPDSVLKEVKKEEMRAAFFYGTHGTLESSIGSQVRIVDRLTKEGIGDIAALKVENTEQELPYTVFHDLSGQGQTDIRAGLSVVIGGFPGELALHAQHRRTGQKQVAVFTYFGMHDVVPFPESPEKIDRMSPPHPKIDFLADFPDNIGSCDPKGMSGGGAWSIPLAKKCDLWSAHKSQLLGIQSGLYRERKLLRLVRIERVLELLSR